MGAIDALTTTAWQLLNGLRDVPPLLLLGIFALSIVGFAIVFYLVIFISASTPRPPLPSERQYTTVLPDGSISERRPLPCWLDKYNAQKELDRRKGASAQTKNFAIDEPDLFMSVVVPAYNEEQRLGPMLEEAVAFLQHEYGREDPRLANGYFEGTKATFRRVNNSNGDIAKSTRTTTAHAEEGSGWEILIISDGSKDRTTEVALDFARRHGLTEPNQHISPKSSSPTRSPRGSLRVVELKENRGKGGAVVHGLRHVRGAYTVFADADGASKFSDLAKLVKACQEVEDGLGRGVAVGSRAHLVGSEAVVKRSKLRNLLMHTFHLLLRLLTTPVTSRIQDTQCGFKLLSRAALPYITPHMHSEGWIFDVEMLMLAESAGIPMAEVAVGWKEVKGSKLNVVWDSMGMAWGLAVLRAAWSLGIYRIS